MLALLLTLCALSIWLYQDAERRQMRTPLAWVALLWLLGPLALAGYWSTRPLFSGEYRHGGRVWVMLKAFLLGVTAWAMLFTAVFTVWLSAIIPPVIVLGVLLSLGLLIAGGWCLLVIGLLFVAWLMRDEHAMEQGPTHRALVGLARPRPGDQLLKVIFMGGLIATFVLTEPSHPQWLDHVDWQSVPSRQML